jgi:integrase
MSRRKRAPREIPLGDAAIAALRAQRIRQTEERLAAGPLWQQGDLVFTTTVGQPLHRSVVTHTLQRDPRPPRAPRLRFHDLRKTCGSLLLDAGIELTDVWAWLGHSNVAITQAIYVPRFEERGREPAARLDALLSRHSRSTASQ